MRPDVERVYAVTERDGGEPIGALHLRRPAPHRVEFGYVPARAAWGRGLMTEALRAGVAWALAERGDVPGRRGLRRRQTRARGG